VEAICPILFESTPNNEGGFRRSLFRNFSLSHRQDGEEYEQLDSLDGTNRGGVPQVNGGHVGLIASTNASDANDGRPYDVSGNLLLIFILNPRL